MSASGRSRAIDLRVKCHFCTNFAARIAGCNLEGDTPFDMRHPIGQLIRNIRLINLNMQAIVEDVPGGSIQHDGSRRRNCSGEQSLG